MHPFSLSLQRVCQKKRILLTLTLAAESRATSNQGCAPPMGANTRGPPNSRAFAADLLLLRHRPIADNGRQPPDGDLRSTSGAIDREKEQCAHNAYGGLRDSITLAFNCVWLHAICPSIANEAWSGKRSTVYECTLECLSLVWLQHLLAIDMPLQSPYFVCAFVCVPWTINSIAHPMHIRIAMTCAVNASMLRFGDLFGCFPYLSTAQLSGSVKMALI